MLKNGINEIKIKSYEELVKLICGKDKRTKHDIREDFIFRGISNVKYELIPSSLRKNNLNQLKINELIESDYKFKVAISEKEVKNNNLIFDSNHRDADKNIVILFNKYGKPTIRVLSKLISFITSFLPNFFETRSNVISIYCPLFNISSIVRRSLTP